jgi:hypothetical protein
LTSPPVSLQINLVEKEQLHKYRKFFKGHLGESPVASHMAFSRKLDIYDFPKQ